MTWGQYRGLSSSFKPGEAFQRNHTSLILSLTKRVEFNHQFRWSKETNTEHMGEFVSTCFHYPGTTQSKFQGIVSSLCMRSPWTCKPLSAAICCCGYHAMWKRNRCQKAPQDKIHSSPFRSVFFPLWKGANKTTIVNQAFYSAGGHGGRDLCIVNTAAQVIHSTASSTGIWVSAPHPPNEKNSVMTVTPLQTRAQK